MRQNAASSGSTDRFIWEISGDSFKTKVVGLGATDTQDAFVVGTGNVGPDLTPAIIYFASDFTDYNDGEYHQDPCVYYLLQDSNMLSTFGGPYTPVHAFGYRDSYSAGVDN